MEKIYKSIEGNLIDFDIAEALINDIEGLLLEAAIHDPIGFRVWHKDFKSYVESKICQRAEESIKAIEKA